MLVLSGIAIIIIGFALGVNPLLVVTVAAFASAAAAGHGPVEVVAMIGKAFVDSRFMAVAYLALPTIGLLERAGLREKHVPWSGGCAARPPGGCCWGIWRCARSPPRSASSRWGATCRWYGRSSRRWPKGRRRGTSMSRWIATPAT